jgi:FkbM family methyltransferase
MSRVVAMSIALLMSIVSANPNPHPWWLREDARTVCSEERIKKNVASFQGRFNCPNEAYYWDWQATLNVKNFVYIEIGCNKGSDALMNLRAFTASPLAEKKTFQEATGLTSGYACGFDDKRYAELSKQTEPRAKNYTHLCVEAAVETATPVKNAVERLGLDKLGLRVVLAAASSTDVPSTIRFPYTKPGQENLGVESFSTKKGETQMFNEVDVLTVDGLVAKHKLSQVDVLKVDTEGNDPRVLIGAVQTLTRMRPSYVAFENHAIGHWKVYALKDVIDYLDRLRYDCFWAANSGELIRLTSCWSEEYSKYKQWSNVVCHHRRRLDLKKYMTAHEVNK